MINKKYYIKVIRKNSKELFPIETGIKEKGRIDERIKSVLFDVYGTLFVSGSGDISISEKEAHERELARVLLKHGIDMDPHIAYSNYINSIKMEHKRLKSMGVDYPEVKIDMIWKNVLNIGIFKARKVAIEYETLVNPVWPMPGAYEILSQLKMKGVELGIISNAQFYTPVMFEALMGMPISKLGFNKKLVFFSYRYSTSKPSLSMFKLACENLRKIGIKPENVVYVGNDILNDIKPALEVGFKTVLFAGDKRSLRLREDDNRCFDITPDIIVTSLINILSRINL